MALSDMGTLIMLASSSMASLALFWFSLVLVSSSIVACFSLFLLQAAKDVLPRVYVEDFEV